MKRNLGSIFGSGDADGRSQLFGYVVRDVDFREGWNKLRPIVPDEATWLREQTERREEVEGRDELLGLFRSAICRGSQMIPRTQLETEEPALFEFLRPLDYQPLLDVEYEVFARWFEDLEELWPRDFGIECGNKAYYRDDGGKFWQIERQTVKITLSRPRIETEGDVEENNLPQLGDVVTNSWEELTKALSRIAAERAWTQPVLLVPWYLRGRTGVDEDEYRISIIRDAGRLAEMRAIRVESPDERFEYDPDSGRMYVFGVDLIAFDVKESANREK